MACWVVMGRAGRQPLREKPWFLFSLEGLSKARPFTRGPQMGRYPKPHEGELLIWVSVGCVCSWNLPLLMLACKWCLGFHYRINTDLFAIVLVRPRRPLSCRFYSCAPRPRCAGCCELRVGKTLPILLMQIRFQVQVTKLFQNLN